MHVVTSKKELADGVQTLEKVTGKQLNLEVLRCILLEAKKDKLFLRATNLDIGIEIFQPCTVKREGTVAVTAATFNSFLSNVDSKDIELHQTKNNLEIKTNQTRAVVNTTPHDDFPTFPSVRGTAFTIAAEKLRQGIQSVWHTASLSTMKPELASVFMFGSGDTLTFVATDSFRLAEKVIQTKKTEGFPRILIPAKNAAEIIRNLEQTKDDEKVEVVIDEKNQASFRIGDNTHITTRLVDGTFPDYTQIIPKEHTTEVTVLKQDLLQALRVAGVFVNKFNQITLVVKPKEKQFLIQTSGEVGEGVVSIDASMSGERFEARFNQKYILDGLQSIRKDSVLIQLAEESKPAVIRGVGDASFMYLVMPMNR